MRQTQFSRVTQQVSPEAFNEQISKIFADFSGMFGEDIYTGLESKMRDEGTTLKNFYFDADKISTVLWDSFRSAAGYLIDSLVVKVSIVAGTNSIRHYREDSSLKRILDDIRREIR